MEASVCKNEPNHDSQSPVHAFGHTDLLWRVGGRKLLDNTRFQDVLSELLPGVLTALVDAPTNDSATEGDEHRADKQLKRPESLVLVGQQVDGGPFSVLVDYLAMYL